VSIYRAYTGDLPETLSALTSPPTTVSGDKGNPLLTTIPNAPCGWSPYTYLVRPDGSFAITTKGDGVTVSVP